VVGFSSFSPALRDQVWNALRGQPLWRPYEVRKVGACRNRGRTFSLSLVWPSFNFAETSRSESCSGLQRTKIDTVVPYSRMKAQIFQVCKSAKADEMSRNAIFLSRNIVMRPRLLTAMALGVVLAAVSPSLCEAQCVDFSERVSRVDLQTFTADPGSLLRQLRNDKEKLSGRLTGYLITDPNVLPSVQKLVNDARTTDRTSIGMALRRAELRCLASKPEVARKINDFVRKLGDATVMTGYAAEPADFVAPHAPTKSSGAGLLSGEWKTEIANPFESMPVPE
jgi:hypothetical protein